MIAKSIYVNFEIRREKREGGRTDVESERLGYSKLLNLLDVLRAELDGLEVRLNSRRSNGFRNDCLKRVKIDLKRYRVSETDQSVLRELPRR